MQDEAVAASAAPKVGWVVVGYGVAAVGIAVGYYLDANTKDVVLKVSEGFSLFAIFYVFAQSLERLLEPVSRQWDAQEKVPEKENAKAQADARLRIAEAAAASAIVMPDGDPGAHEAAAEAAAGTKANADRSLAKVRANKEVVLWGVATAMAALVCGALGLRFLETIVTVDSTAGFRLMDLILTALVIGSGTKPLHDLIDRIQKPKPATT
jgi:hypothetical protein